MKKQMLLLLAAMVMFQLQAQKIKVTDGDLNFLKGEEFIDIMFTYDEDLKVGKLTEDKYIQQKMAVAEEDEPGAGERWKKAWYEDRPVHFEPKFQELLNRYTEDADVIFRPGIDEAKYKMIVNTIFIEPGFNVGVARKSASVDLEILIVPIDNDGEILAKILILAAPGKSMSYGDYDVGIRVGEGYAKAGKELGKFLIKKKAF